MIYIYKYLLIDLFFYKEIAFGGNFDSPHEFFGASMGNWCANFWSVYVDKKMHT